MKLGSELEPLQPYSAELIAPFEGDGDPLPPWYRIAVERIRSVRFVFWDAEAGFLGGAPISSPGVHNGSRPP